MFVEIAAPAIVMLEQQLCGSGNIHGAESTGRYRAGKVRRRQPAHATGVLILMVRKLNHRFKIFLTMSFISWGGLIAHDRVTYGEKMLFSAHF